MYLKMLNAYIKNIFDVYKKVECVHSQHVLTKKNPMKIDQEKLRKRKKPDTIRNT